MRAYQRSDILFSLHIPKCGGTSFTKVLRQWFWPSLHAHYIAHDQGGRLPGRPHPVKAFLHHARIKPMVIHGHFEDEAALFGCYPNATQFITILRDPLEMQLSLYWDHQRRIKQFGTLYWKGFPVEMEYDGDLDRWVAERPFYLMPFLPFGLTMVNFRERIESCFVHVGVMERFQESVNRLAKQLGKTPVSVPSLNQSQREREPSAAAVEAFKQRCALEYAIYNWALELNC
jgi:hypothetical protein